MLGLIRDNKLGAALVGVAALMIVAGVGMMAVPVKGVVTTPVTTSTPATVERAGLPFSVDHWIDASIPDAMRRTPVFGTAPMRIVGGRKANWQDHPGAVRMQAVTMETTTSKGGQLCGGTAIHPRWIVTAAHCVEGDVLRFDFWYGANAWEDAERVHGFRAYKHPAYRDFGLSGDAAVVYLDTPLPDTFPLARLATEAEYRALDKGDLMIARGWGTTRGGIDGGRDPSATLQEVELKIYKAGELRAEVVSRDGAERGPCQGDSGGGLIREGGDPAVIYGPLSYVQPTATGVCKGAGYAAGYTSATLVLWGAAQQ